jgi:hypothetical protein
MPTATGILTGFAGLIAILSLAVYLFGIPPELKKKMEKAALKTMGENKASYIMKGTILLPTNPSSKWNEANSTLNQTKYPKSLPRTKKKSRI